MKAILLFCIWFALFGICSKTASVAGRPDWEALIFQANRAHKEGRYREAAEAYGRILRAGHHNGHLYYNIANAFYHLDELGRAILFYERAHLFIPRDADLNFNRSQAIDQTRDAPPESTGLIQSTFFWLDGLKLTELFWAFAMTNGLFFGLLSVRLFYRAEWTYYLLFTFLFFEIIAAGSFGLKWYQIRTDRRAVILKAEIEVFAGPDVQDTVLFKLHAGTVVHYERSEDGWALVRFSKDKRGWVRSQDIACILCTLNGSPDETGTIHAQSEPSQFMEPEAFLLPNPTIGSSF
jgi:tetratricopeptide (TPR) repeat protein